MTIPNVAGYIEVYCPYGSESETFERIKALNTEYIAGIFVLRGKVYPSLIVLTTDKDKTAYVASTLIQNLPGGLRVKTALVGEYAFGEQESALES